MDKIKLSFDEQIEDLKSKNVKFELFVEEDAKKFLQYNNYYFKLKSYARNYIKYSKKELKDKYVNLDFAYLVELSTLDMYFRRLIVGLCLDIEHILKTRFMRDVTNNDNEDGYNIVKRFINSDYSILTNLFSNKDKSATSELIQKFKEDESKIPVWSLIETLSFGRFIELYNLYYGIYGGHSYTSYLGSIKFLRNAAAHNTCLLNSLRKPYSIKINKNMDIMDVLTKSKKFQTSYRSKMENPIVHDFVVLLFVYYDITNTAANRSMRDKGMNRVKTFFQETVLRNKSYFVKNDVLVENYRFVCQIVEYLENCRNRPVLRK
ncbi:hypothetical protein BXO88_04110 [Oribacterium sp. C9]|uniref:Abi family protein n=1 Tax=Oribacterium sp. C9 TaxID=1943579 RepID=UPI00098EB527|nr:Abi family protein [Oribacterium sp. C9]OON87526.1 hypothetical protein BXO88_04110 [Oribacterium sp. C9]